VVYLLHGHSDNETAMGPIRRIQQHLTGHCKQGFSTMIVVMPDAKVTWYVNDFSGRTGNEDMIFEEFIPYIDKTYRTRTNKEYRAVSGLSMGGFGSLIWSLHHPEMFSACAAFSAGVFTDEEVKICPIKDIMICWVVYMVK